jgi:hypothetical protein
MLGGHAYVRADSCLPMGGGPAGANAAAMRLIMSTGWPDSGGWKRLASSRAKGVDRQPEHHFSSIRGCRLQRIVDYRPHAGGLGFLYALKYIHSL